ncbi:MAG: nucleotide sugar dehydrogenase [Fidelibacterota bacterium]|nr:MAG: nucleotide sugar dehydrogenase [Candidatus Neomarinimicrobiota bacterium]
MRDTLIQNIEEKTFVTGIIGLGYVGLPLLYTFSESGFRCIGFDVDADKVRMLDRGKSYIKHISERRVKQGADSGLVTATTDFSKLRECDGIIITVPTPLSANREPDLSFIVDTCETIASYIRRGHLVVLESTTYPGTTEEVLVPILERSGLKVDQDFYVAYSPEREDPNNPEYTTTSIPKVVGSTSPDGLAVAEKLYQQIIEETVSVSSVKAAEASKLMENIFRAVNIALVNELKIAFMKMGIDIWEVIEAASTKPFGYMPFYPGPGLGGHCIPVDPFYLTWKAREYGIYTKFIELAGEINTSMPDFVISRIMEVLSEDGKPLKGSKIIILGLAYKPNVDDARESPSLYLMNKLEQLGADVSYHDPFIPVIPHTRKFNGMSGRKSVAIDDSFDLILIATAHDDYRKVDFDGLETPVVDTRNVLRGESPWYHKA